VPFYEWSKWIEQRFEKEILDYMYRKNNRKTKRIVSKVPYAVSISLFTTLWLLGSARGLAKNTVDSVHRELFQKVKEIINFIIKYYMVAFTI